MRAASSHAWSLPAIDQYQEVLHGEKLWERGVQALERLVIHDDHRARVIELLEPVYRAQDWWQKLVVVLDAKLEYVMDPTDQVQTLHEIADLHEERGGALDLALAALARAWRIDVADDVALTKLLSLADRVAIRALGRRGVSPVGREHDLAPRLDGARRVLEAVLDEPRALRQRFDAELVVAARDHVVVDRDEIRPALRPAK